MGPNWRYNLKKLKDRGQFLAQSDSLVDCRFHVGTPPDRRIISGHRLLFSMASSIFQHMFYDNVAENSDPVDIPDVKPDIFEAIKYYIYTDEVRIETFEDACGLYYAAKKFKLPFVIQNCTNFLVDDLCSSNACRAYELAKLIEDTRLEENCMKYIANNTMLVIEDPSFMNIKVSTLMAILDQNYLNVDSELDMFNCLWQFSKIRGTLKDRDENNTTNDLSEKGSDGDVVENNILEPEDSILGAASLLAGVCINATDAAGEVAVLDNKDSTSGNASESTANEKDVTDDQDSIMDEAKLREAIKKIRFLSMTPQQFIKGPKHSKLLNENEAFAILTNLVTPTVQGCPMPEGFCNLTKRPHGGIEDEHRYCIRATRSKDSQREYMFSNKSKLTFKVDTDIFLHGIHLKLKRSYKKIEPIFAYVDKENAEVACTSSMENQINIRSVLPFSTPILVKRNQFYKIRVVTMYGNSMIMSEWHDSEMVNHGVKFTFELDPIPLQQNVGTAISGIIFTPQQSIYMVV